MFSLQLCPFISVEAEFSIVVPQLKATQQLSIVVGIEKVVCLCFFGSFLLFLNNKPEASALNQHNIPSLAKLAVFPLQLPPQVAHYVSLPQTFLYDCSIVIFSMFT